MRTRFTAGFSGVAADLARNAAVPADEAALSGAFAAQLSIVAARWPVADVAAVGSGCTAGKSE